MDRWLAECEHREVNSEFWEEQTLRSRIHCHSATSDTPLNMGGCFLSALGTLWWASVILWASPGNEAPSFIEKLLHLYCSSGSCVLFAPLAPLSGRRQACALVLMPRPYHSGFSLRARAGKKQEPEQVFPAMVASAVSLAAGTEVAVLREVASSVHGQQSQQSDSALAARSQAGLDWTRSAVCFSPLLLAPLPLSLVLKPSWDSASYPISF